jgi:hypothetical protein
MVRWRISSSRPRCITNAGWCSFVSTGTKRIEGRVTASQIASVSAGGSPKSGNFLQLMRARATGKRYF